ncbi:MAG: hypothetical protein JO022_03225 [Acidobacteriaceae bacterium]|nr:hypothetical protein [Acidobacteriaceae bacterium]
MKIVETAEFGALDPEVAQDIALLREFAANRQRQLNRLLGRNLRHSPLRDELLRLIILSFAASRHQRISFYVRSCAVYATEPSVRIEIEQLASAGLILLTRDRLHSRALLVVPTCKLVRFYNEQMPRLRHEVMSLLSNVQHTSDKVVNQSAGRLPA